MAILADAEVIYLDNIKIDEWESRFPGLKLHPESCPDCHDEPWNSGLFRFWVSHSSIGVDRSCGKCERNQTMITKKSREKNRSLANVLSIIP